MKETTKQWHIEEDGLYTKKFCDMKNIKNRQPIIESSCSFPPSIKYGLSASEILCYILGQKWIIVVTINTQENIVN